LLKNESTTKTRKTKNVSFGDIFHFLNSFYAIRQFSEWTQE